MKKLISRNEAAEILQVHPQTISNYAERGILKEVRKGSRKYCYYYEDQVKAIIQNVQEIEADQKEILAYQAEIEETKKKFKEIKDEWHKKLHAAQGSAKIYEYATSLLKRCADNDELARREKEVIKAYLDLKTTDEIAEEMGYGGQTIRYIFHRATRKLMVRSSKAEQYDAVVSANESLRMKIVELEETIRAIKAIKIQAGASTDVVNSVADASNNIFDRYPILKERIVNDGISVRTHNCFKAADIDTFADLVSHTRQDLMRFRNVGRKSLEEIDLLLERNGLRYGMLPKNEQKARGRYW